MFDKRGKLLTIRFQGGGGRGQFDLPCLVVDSIFQIFFSMLKIVSVRLKGANASHVFLHTSTNSKDICTKLENHSTAKYFSLETKL